MPNMRKGQGPVGSVAGPSPMPRGFKAAAWTPERQKKSPIRSDRIRRRGLGQLLREEHIAGKHQRRGGPGPSFVACAAGGCGRNNPGERRTTCERGAAAALFASIGLTIPALKRGRALLAIKAESAVRRCFTPRAPGMKCPVVGHLSLVCRAQASRGAATTRQAPNRENACQP